ncbi:MAG: SMP-30/gluconolactonase/LRE family protein [Chthoniobacter sp.]|nr:SMP-30/gluconolactonase/LRE family protein [Chthoniobacter sp.]
MKHLALLLLAPVLALAAEEPAAKFRIQRLDPALDAVLPPDAIVEKVAEGFRWAEGPVWKDDAVLFSDVPENIIYRWGPGDTAAKIFLQPSGGAASTPAFREPGSNGLARDAENRLILCQHALRRIARLEKDGKQTALADRYEGKRFNSPNDLAIAKNGDIYFTDPPYGLAKGNESPLKELEFSGVFRLSGGKVTLLTDEHRFPNGIALSPDEKTLYVNTSDPRAPHVHAYPLNADGTLGKRRVFFDTAPLTNVGPGLPDGLKVDRAGNVWTSGPGGILIISPAGKHLGTIVTGQPTSNCAWGEDGSTLFITANKFLLRVKTDTKGAGW